MTALNEDLVRAVETMKREALSRDAYTPLRHLTSDLSHLGADLIRSAAFIEAYEIAQHPSSFRMEDLRNYALKAGRALAAYDAMIAAGVTMVSNADWKKLRDGGAQ